MEVTWEETPSRTLQSLDLKQGSHYSSAPVVGRCLELFVQVILKDEDRTKDTGSKTGKMARRQRGWGRGNEKNRR